jgi:pimeloyl-ACP methyl ester carboxylesterase
MQRPSAASRTPSPESDPTALRHGPRWIAIQVALLVFFLGIFALSVLQIRGYEAGITRQSFVLHGRISAPVTRYTPTRRAVNEIAVLAHGYAANKEIMSAFAVELARQGITAYTFDFPGHGASDVPYGSVEGSRVAVPRLVATLGEVVDYATAHATTPQPKIVLIGYSLGTIAVGEYALQHPQQSDIRATVLVAGILQDRLTPLVPRNVLVLSGQFDLPGINATAQRLMASGCGVALARVSDVYTCNTSTPYPRSRIVLPGLDHISIVTAASTHAAVLNWLHETVDARIGAAPVNADVRLHWFLLGVLAATLAVVPLVALGATALGRFQPASSGALSVPRPVADQAQVWKSIGMIAAALVAALGVIHLWLPAGFWAPEPFPFGFLNQQVSADVALFLLVAGAFLWVGRRFLTLPPVTLSARNLREMALQALLALGVVVALYFTVGKLSSYAWESLALTPARLWHAAVYALMVLPFFAAVQAMLKSVAWQSGGRAAAFEGAATLLVLASFVGAILMNFARLSYLGILFPVVGILLVSLLGLNAWIRRIVPNSTALIAVMQSLILGWIFAATLPFIH